ncbi:hypothetical protein WG907_02490 [Sphingobium sp. AN558]|uniref:hypothetical protein n=1 Tax=Sphingobium sp. AN558 TaxID=3133442 RepID=UPI0030C2B7CE
MDLVNDEGRPDASATHDVLHDEPIFIHAAFRSSSTYVLDHLIIQENVVKIYEPLHEGFGNIPQLLQRPNQQGDFFSALELPMGGVKGFRKAFGTERMFLGPDDDHPPLQNYIDILLEEAKSRGLRPVIKEVRTQGRISWLRKRFGGVHIGLIRDPRSQFRSYRWNARHGNWYFLAQVCQVYAFNIVPIARALTLKFVDIPIFSNAMYAEEHNFYERVAKSLSTAELYFIFMYVWFWSTLNCVVQADVSFELPLGQREADLNGLLKQHGVAVDTSRFRGSLAIDEDLAYSDMLPDIEKIALGCFKLDFGGLSALAPSTYYLSPSTQAYIDALFLPDLSFPVESSRVFNGKVLKSLLLLEANARSLPLRSLAPYISYGHRNENDPDNLLRFSPSSVYLPQGSLLEMSPSDGYSVVRFVSESEGLVCYGPHFDLPAGSYEVFFDVRAEKGGRAPLEPNVFINVIAQRGLVNLTPKMAFDITGRREISVVFECTIPQALVEPRLSVIGSVEVYGMYIVAKPAASSVGA